MPLPLICLITLLASLPGQFVWAALISKSAAMRSPKKFILILMCTQSILVTVKNYVLPAPSALFEMVMNLSFFGVTWYFACPGQKLRALASCMVYLMSYTLTILLIMFIASPILLGMGIPQEAFGDPRSMVFAVMCFICSLAIIPGMYGCYRLLFAKKRDIPGLLLFLPVPLSQLTIVTVAVRMIGEAGLRSDVKLPLLLGILLCLVADGCYFVGIGRQAKMALLEKEKDEAEAHLDVQAQYYRQLQSSILTVNQIRHDLNNQLLAANCLLERGETDLVRDQLDALMKDIRNKVGTKYCGNPMVDAVLSEKAKTCQEKGISLDINAQLPPDVPIEHTHLCSAFSNLLDNSIRAVKEAGIQEPWIRLSASVQSGCLVIQCTNPAPPPRKKASEDPLRLHGLGLGILERIAKLYGGTLETKYEDGQFHAALVLRLT